MVLKTIKTKMLAGVAGVVVLTLGAGLLVGAGAEPKQTGLKGAGGKAVAHLAGGKKITAPNTPTARWFNTTLDAGEPTIA
ncbi:MAG: hypothetical protein M3217_00345, partial [Actinomycetota bacterium]|nr:hypothetical protein [Actinomycetota bacterium]